MKTKLLTLVFSTLTYLGNAQTRDTIISTKNQKKLSYKELIAPVALISTGVFLLNSKINSDIQTNSRKLFGTSFHTSTDNFSLLVPVGQIFLGKYLGYKPKNDFQHQSVNIIIANGIMGVTVLALKNTFKEERPDKSDQLSFPSGHTAIAFTNAALLYYEYKDSNIWYASSGYLFAAATGVLRVANNKHFTSDVLTGAGIGIASGMLVSYLNPFQSVRFGKSKKTTAFIYPQIGNSIGMGMVLQSN
jgi:membrane-associated phospholipid phosphatase